MQTEMTSWGGDPVGPSLRGAGVKPLDPHLATDAPGGSESGAPFAGVLHEAMSNLQGLEQQATNTVAGLVEGRGVDIHTAMIATEKSDLAFETALAVRGKMVSAYQTMMGVQF